MFKIFDAKMWAIIVLGGIVAISSSFGLGWWRGDASGYSRAKAEWDAATVEATKNHGMQILAREEEKRKLLDRIVEDEISRSAAGQAQLPEVVIDPSNKALQEFIPDAMQEFWEKLPK